MSVIIRNAEKEDFDEVYPLLGQLWPGKPIDRSELKKTCDTGADSGRDVFLCAAEDGRIIGFCAYAIVNNLWQEGLIGYICAMAMDEALRGRGIGTMPITESLGRAEAQGLKRMELDSGFPRGRAHAFYERLGFEKRAYLFSYVL